MRKVLFAIGLLMFLSACSSTGSSVTNPSDTSNSPTSPPVSIDPQIRAQMDVQPGSAIIPGSIKSTPQDLDSECTKAVQPLRDLMVKYQNSRQVPTDGSYAAAFQAGKHCEEIDPQQWADFYVEELAGWIYGE